MQSFLIILTYIEISSFSGFSTLLIWNIIDEIRDILFEVFFVWTRGNVVNNNLAFLALCCINNIIFKESYIYINAI